MINEMLYSSCVQKYAQITQDIFLLPDDIFIKDGIACGDSITIIGEVNEGIIEFKMAVEGCLLCKATANLLFEKYNGKEIYEVIDSCRAWVQNLKVTPEIILSFFGIEKLTERIECIVSPIEMFLNFAIDLSDKKVEIFETKDTKKELDCDACVRSSRINWTGDKSVVKKREPDMPVTTEYKANWSKVAKVYLSEAEVGMLRKLYSEMTDADFNFLQHEKIAQMVYSNLLNHNINISGDNRWKNIVYQVHRKHIVQGEIQQLKNYIMVNDIEAYFVKGAYNNSLYTGNNVRTHLDYDLICLSEQDAFRLGNFLFRKGYTIFTGVFSLKNVIIQGKATYSGHFHVQKVINDQYKLIIDINFPGFPMGRIEIFKPQTTNGYIINEDQLIVTLCHAFKHKDVYMKDINDIYLMLKTRNLNFRYIGDLIKKNNLSYYASLLFAYIFKNYDLEETLKQKITADIEIDFRIYEDFPQWPYDAQTALTVKQNDLNMRLRNSVDNLRIYLFPLAIFKKYYYLDELKINTLIKAGFDIKQLSDCIFQVSCDGLPFVFTNMGLFLDTTVDVSELGRKQSRLIIERFLRISEFSDVFDIPYALKTPEVWYY